jgi:hypothetical protein
MNKNVKKSFPNVSVGLPVAQSVLWQAIKGS